MGGSLLVRVVEWIVAGLALAFVVWYVQQLPQVRRHWRPVVAVLLLAGATAALLASFWSPSVANALAKFILSPGLGSVAAVVGAGLALYGVFRQLQAAQQRQLRAEELNSQRQAREDELVRAEHFAAHFRWVADRVFASTTPADLPLIVALIEGLYHRAPTATDQQAVTDLLDRHEERVAESSPIGSSRRRRWPMFG